MRKQMKNERKNGWNRWNLGQNSCWNINLLLKINFSCWIKNWEQSGRWITILPLESHLGRRINTGVIWAVRSRCMKEGKYHQKISDISPIYHRFFATRGDFLKKSPIYFPEPMYHRYIVDILAIFTEISPLRFFSMIFSSMDTTHECNIIGCNYGIWHDACLAWKESIRLTCMNR